MTSPARDGRAAATAGEGGGSVLLRRAGQLAPGLLVCFAGVAAATGLRHFVPAVPLLLTAVVLGIGLANCGLGIDPLRAGFTFAARHLLRLGVVLLGLQLAVADIADLGLPLIGVVVGVVCTTFFGAQRLGRRMGLGREFSLLIATGFSICGASAIAAVDGAVGADEEEVAYAVALVTLCGTTCIVALPVLGAWMGLDPTTFGAWVGASVHDVGQVVATASSNGPDSIRTAVVVKLGRVVLLAPIVVGVGLAALRGGGEAPPSARRPPLVPLFVVGFLAAVAVRSTGALPDRLIVEAKVVQDLVFAAALVALGAAVDVRRLRRLGGRPVVLALSASVFISAVSLGGVLVAL